MLIVANWKAYIESAKEAEALFTAIKGIATKETQLVLAPSYLHLGLLTKGNRSAVAFAAQDVSVAEGGAATGEVTASMLKQEHVSYVIVGHSERRAKGESNQIVLEKVEAALAEGLIPIVCIGEEERDEEGTYLQKIRAELHSLFSVLTAKERTRIVIAYEPIWAIGKGALAAITPADLNEMIRYIRKVLGDYMPATSVKKMSILYGGSVDETNAKELIEGAAIDGFLVGRASTDAKKFKALVKSVGA